MSITCNARYVTPMYNRLFTKILDSSIWLEDVTTRIVWITLLAAMDEDGYAHFSAIENLALRARVTVEDAQLALGRLMSPDPNSENPANEGRRVERVQGGFLVINATEHRKTMNREIRREQTRLRVARHREKQKSNVDGVTGALRSVTSASASASAKEEDCKGKPTREMVDQFFQDDPDEADKFWDYYQSNGWKVGRNPMKDWEATARNWSRKAFNQSNVVRMSPQHRQNRINYFNDKKQKINRMITDPNNPPSWAVKELARIDQELQQL